MHQLGVRHVQVPSDRLVGVQPGLRQRVPPQRRSDRLLLRNAVRGANLGSPERPLRAEARSHRHDHVALAFRGRLIRKKKTSFGLFGFNSNVPSDYGSFGT